jgi:hypothetical protein
MNRQLLRFVTVASAAILIGSVAVVGVSAGRSDLRTARAATARFHDLGLAKATGYGLPPAPAPLHECISSFDDSGAMGFHYIKGDLLDTVVDPARPEALVFAPDKHGKLKLAALEYVVFQDPWNAKWLADHGPGVPVEMPQLFGQEFMPVSAPNRYEIPAFYALHVWLWNDNPSGLFAPFNPSVSCGAEASTSASTRLATTTGSPPQFACAIEAKRA